MKSGQYDPAIVHLATRVSSLTDAPAAGPRSRPRSSICASRRAALAGEEALSAIGKGAFEIDVTLCAMHPCLSTEEYADCFNFLLTHWTEEARLNDLSRELRDYAKSRSISVSRAECSSLVTDCRAMGLPTERPATPPR